uniref:Uncharacterized protein n=1 Tax=Glossina austeni TaxID=7395 RepID=A0A1A9ULB8_GLOAU
MSFLEGGETFQGVEALIINHVRDKYFVDVGLLFWFLQVQNTYEKVLPKLVSSDMPSSAAMVVAVVVASLLIQFSVNRSSALLAVLAAAKSIMAAAAESIDAGVPFVFVVQSCMYLKSLIISSASNLNSSLSKQFAGNDLSNSQVLHAAHIPHRIGVAFGTNLGSQHGCFCSSSHGFSYGSHYGLIVGLSARGKNITKPGVCELATASLVQFPTPVPISSPQTPSRRTAPTDLSNSSKLMGIEK